MDDIMPVKNARNVALFFTFLGAASYMHGAAPEMPDPSEVINAENVAALMKMGLAGGVLKTMKEAAAKTVGGAGVNTSRTSEGNDCNQSSPPLLSAMPDENSDAQQQSEHQLLTPDMIAMAIKHPVSSNPYDHPNPSTGTNSEIQPASLFSFNAVPSSTDGTLPTGTGSALDSGEAPSGCVGGKCCGYLTCSKDSDILFIL
jgi:hypothetical protein